VDIDVTKKEYFHITIAVRYRKPKNFENQENIEQEIETSSPHLKTFWESLKI